MKAKIIGHSVQMNERELEKSFLALACLLKYKFQVNGERAKEWASGYMLMMPEKENELSFRNINTRCYLRFDLGELALFVTLSNLRASGAILSTQVKESFTELEKKLFN